MGEIDPLRTYNVTDLSKLLGVKREVVYGLIRSGRLQASTISPERRGLRVPAFSVMQLFEQPERRAV